MKVADLVNAAAAVALEEGYESGYVGKSVQATPTRKNPYTEDGK